MPSSPSSSPSSSPPLAARAAARAAALAALLVSLAALAPAAGAQAPGALVVGPPQPELRVDAIGTAERQTYQLGAGVLWPVGRAVRAGAVLAGGVADGTGRSTVGLGWRVEGVVHFVVRTGPTGRARLYLGAGAGALSTADGDHGARALAHLLVGREGSGQGWQHAVEVGLGGGVRLGVVLRRAR